MRNLALATNSELAIKEIKSAANPVATTSNTTSESSSTAQLVPDTTVTEKDAALAEAIEAAATQRYGLLALSVIGGVIVFAALVDWFSFWYRAAAQSGAQGEFISPALWICVALFPIALVIATFFRRRQITIDNEGVTIFHPQNTKPRNLEFIQWRNFRKLRIVNIGPERLVCIDAKDGRIFRFPYRQLADCMDPSEFFSAVRSWAPGVIREDVALLKEESNHTRLWLDSFVRTHGRSCSSELAAGTKLQEGRLHLLGVIGQGGQGTAYLAAVNAPVDLNEPTTKPMPSEVVLKEYILPMHHFRTQSILTENAEKLTKEATILEKIDHEQIVRFYGHFVEDYRGYLVMEHVAGTSLKELVGREGKQPESFVIDIASQICDILTYLHGLSPPILHRDLTPDNLILQDNGKVKLVDFNVAHQLESSATATVVGKHAFIPPEQFKGKPLPQSDVYALGCTMHFLLTGREPEPITPSSPQSLCQSVSDTLNQIVKCATALSCHERFASAQQLKAALHNQAVVDE